MPRMNRRRMLEALMALMSSPAVSMKRARLRREHGLTTYDGAGSDLRNIRIKIDGRNAAVLTIAIHELLHVFMEQQYNFATLFSEELEEAIVKSLADDLGDYINNPKNERLLAQWARAVAAKMGE